MASTPVTQYSSPDPSLVGFANFGQFSQYLITGTNYIVDNKAQIVYLFNPAQPGVLENTDGSYSQFQAYLAANPVTSVLPNPNGPPGGNFLPSPTVSNPGNPNFTTTGSVYDVRLYELLENILLEVRCMRLASVSLATQGGVAAEEDFNPTRDAGFSGSDSVAFS